MKTLIYKQHNTPQHPKLHSGHARRIAGYARCTAFAINAVQSGPLEPLRFNKQNMVELTYAALFHDAVSLVPEQERADTLQLLSQLSWPAQYRSIPAIAHIFDHITTCVRPCTAGSVLLPWRSALNALAAVYRNEFIINLKVPMKK